MTEKEVIAKYAELMEMTLADSKKAIDTYTTLVVDTAMGEGKCSFGKVGTFKKADVAARPAKLGVKNALVPGATYDIAAKPARTKLAFGLSKSGRLIGA